MYDSSRLPLQTRLAGFLPALSATGTYYAVARNAHSTFLYVVFFLIQLSCTPLKAVVQERRVTDDLIQ